MFQTLAKSVRAELCKEGQHPGVDESGEQSGEAERQGLAIGIPAGVRQDESGKEDQKGHMGSVKRVGEAGKLAGDTNGAGPGRMRGTGREQYPKEERRE